MREGTATLDPPSRLVVAVGAWFVAALAIGASGLISHAPWVMPLLVAGTIAIGVRVFRSNAGVRARVRAIDARWLAATHLVRVVVGIAFLVLYSRGVLPGLFALRAGPGDIAIGLLALGVIAALPAAGAIGRRFVLAWTVLGIVDLIVAFSTAQYLVFVAHDTRMLTVGHLPYALVPVFIVPALVMSHLLILDGLRRRQ
jgi:hypothetical protein